MIESFLPISERLSKTSLCIAPYIYSMYHQQRIEVKHKSNSIDQNIITANHDKNLPAFHLPSNPTTAVLLKELHSEPRYKRLSGGIL